MKTTELTITEARALYVSSDATGKKMLEQKFSKEALTESLRDKLETWELVCEKDGIDPVTSLPYPEPKNGEERFLNACKKISVISRVFREGRKHDWADSSKYKYYPWWNMSSVSGLSCNGYDHSDAHSCVGSRLCFMSSDDVKFVAEHYKDVYEDLMLEIGRAHV